MDNFKENEESKKRKGKHSLLHVQNIFYQCRAWSHTFHMQEIFLLDYSLDMFGAVLLSLHQVSFQVSQAIPEPNPRQCALGCLWCCWRWFYQSSSWSCPWLCHLGSGAGSQGADLAPFPLACLGGGALALGDWWFCLPWRHLRALWASPTPLIHRIPFCCFFFCVIANTDFLC